MGKRSEHKPWNRGCKTSMMSRATHCRKFRGDIQEHPCEPELQWGNAPGTDRAQTLESHFPMSMRSGPHIGDILVTRIIMVRPAALRQNVRFTTRSCTRHARSPQRVARGQTLKPELQWGNAKSTKPCHQNYNGGTHRAHQKCTFHHTFARSTRTISAEGCSRTNAIRVSPHARAIDGHDSTRGLRFVRPARTAPPPKEKNKEEVG